MTFIDDIKPYLRNLQTYIHSNIYRDRNLFFLIDIFPENENIECINNFSCSQTEKNKAPISKLIAFLLATCFSNLQISMRGLTNLL